MGAHRDSARGRPQPRGHGTTASRRADRTRADRAGDGVERWRRRFGSAVIRRALRGRLLAVLAALSVLYLTVSTVDSATRREHELGTLTEVLVAARDLTAGSQLEPASIRVEQWPVAFVPDGALASLDHGARLRADVVAGEVLHSTRVGEETSPTAARLGHDQAAVPLPAGTGTAAATVGDAVDIYAPAGPAAGFDGPLASPGANRVAARASVLERGDDNIVVAVRRSEVADTMAAAMGPGVGLVVLGSVSGARDGDVVDDE